jgi:RHS repeat-associated protein
MTKNYLKNHNAEIDYEWYPNNSGAVYTTEQKYLGSRSLKISSAEEQGEKYFAQVVPLAKGKSYTFSGYIKTTSVSNKVGAGAVLTLSYLDVNNQWQYLRKFVNGTNDWQRYEVSFDYPANAANTSVWLAVEMLNASGTAYFDALQLEEEKIANRYNLIENGDFSQRDSVSWKPLHWNMNPNIDGGDYVVEDTNGHPKSLDNYSMRVNGDGSKGKGLFQTINISGSETDVYVLGGWAKADSVLIKDPRLFDLELGFEKADGTRVWKAVKFNEDSTDWQYASTAIRADVPYVKIHVYLDYYHNENTAYFDGIQLYKESFGISYQYDSKGNLMSTQDLNKQNSTFEYNSSNDLVKTTGANGGSFAYAYSADGKKNLTKATSAENVVYSFPEYDSYGNPKKSRVEGTGLFIETNAIYTDSGNYMKSITDSSGYTVGYSYNEAKGTLDNVTDANGKVTTYGYDGLDRITSVSKSVEGRTITNVYNYLNDRIDSITHNGFSYNFGYDSFGNNTTVAVAGKNLITNIFDPKTNLLNKSTYANNQAISSDYDSLGRVKVKKYTSNAGLPGETTEERYKYEYDAKGNVGYHEDLVNGSKYRYTYDLADRLAGIKDTKNNSTQEDSVSYGYDLSNNINSVTENIAGKSYSTSYTFDKDNKLQNMSYSRTTTNTITLTYDPIARLKTKVINTGTNQYTVGYSYEAGINGSTTTKVSSIDNNGKSISYIYDKNGNIDTVTQGGKQIKYYYNELNELKQEDNQVLNKTIIYSYDDGGNISSKLEIPYGTGSVRKTIAYTYDPVWKDKLMSYDGKPITYDAIGNPLTYDGYNFTWEEGRQLKGISGNSKVINYKYNDSGIRTQKTVNGIITNYRLVGDKVTLEDNGTDKIYYTYDASGNLVSMNLNEVEYYYIRNAQGDIIGLFDKDKNEVVSYTYDSWGRIVSVSGSMASTVGEKNPYRYRGYRYDTETGLYYLQSRYYNPEWGRFVNGDAYGGQIGKLISHNIFAYCGNDPINNYDSNGYSLRSIRDSINKAVFTIIVGIVSIINYNLNKSSEAIADLVSSAVDTVKSAAENTVSYIKSKTKSSSISKTDTDNKSEPSKAKYFAAERDPNLNIIIVRQPISEADAIIRVASKQSVMAIDYNSAKRLAKKFPGAYQEVDVGKYGALDYYPHFHINNSHGDPHIWFYPGNN